MDVYSTASVPASTRATYWNDVYSRCFAQVTFSPLDREDFEAELKKKGIPSEMPDFKYNDDVRF